MRTAGNGTIPWVPDRLDRPRTGCGCRVRIQRGALDSASRTALSCLLHRQMPDDIRLGDHLAQMMMLMAVALRIKQRLPLDAAGHRNLMRRNPMSHASASSSSSPRHRVTTAR